MSCQHSHPRIGIVLALAAWSTAGGATFRGRVVVEDFEHCAWGGHWATAAFSNGADPRVAVEREDPHSGEQAWRLHVPRGSTLTLVTQHGTGFASGGEKPPLPLPGTPERVGLWVRGAGSGHRLWVRLVDAKGKAADLELGRVDFTGWRLLGAPVPKLTPPVALRGLSVGGGRGPLVIDDVTVTTVASQPLHVTVRRVEPWGEPVDGERVRFRVVVQSLSSEPIRGRVEVSAVAPGSVHEPADRCRFRFTVSAGAPVSRTVGLRVAAGVYRLLVRAGEAECSRRVVVYPEAGRGRAVSAGRAVRRFGERGDAVRVIETALSPAVVIESRSDTLTLFRALQAVGLRAPRESLMRVRESARGVQYRDLPESWMLLWFGGTPGWHRVTFADGEPSPTFDVPFLVVLEHAPEKVDLGEGGLVLRFRRRAGRVAVMPLYGVRRPRPSETSGWKEDVETIGRVAEVCRFWARAVRALPIGVEESWRVDVERDVVEVRARFEYLDTRGDWGERRLRLAPVPPLLMLACRAGLRVWISTAPLGTSCHTAVGPYVAVSDAGEYTYSVRGLLRHVRRTLAGAPAGGPAPPVRLAGPRRTLADGVHGMPFWLRAAPQRGRAAAEAVLRSLLWEDNARYELDPSRGRLRAVDGLAWRTQGMAAARAAAADHLRGCWYAGFHAGHWELVRRRWRHVQALREALRPGGDWATLGLGSGPVALDDRLGGELFFARLAAHLGERDAFAEACGGVVKLLVAGQALAGGARAYTGQHAPWPSLVGRPDDQTPLGRCMGGSLGLSPGPLPFVTRPCDGGYGFADESLPSYFARHFRGGPLGYYGRKPEAWRRRGLVELDVPDVGGRWWRERAGAEGFAGNFVYSVAPGPDGWPALRWASHRSPKGGPLLFGTIGTKPNARGKLLRSLDVSPHLRLSAYGAIEGPPPAKAATPPGQPAPGELPQAPAADTPARDRP